MDKQSQPPPYSAAEEHMMNPHNIQNMPTAPSNQGFQYAPLVASPQPVIPPPQSVTNVVVTSGGHRTGCPVCGNPDFTGTYPCHAWLCCLFCSWVACLGCIWCLCMRRKKCTKCGFQTN